MIGWRSVDHKGMNYCWKKLAEKKRKKWCWTSTSARTAKERLIEAEAIRWNGGVYEGAKSTEYEKGERIVEHGSLLCSGNLTCSESWTGGCRLVG